MPNQSLIDHLMTELDIIKKCLFDNLEMHFLNIWHAVRDINFNSMTSWNGKTKLKLSRTKFIFVNYHNKLLILY